jgi:hypothetical protein
MVSELGKSKPQVAKLVKELIKTDQNPKSFVSSGQSKFSGDIML